MLAHTYIIMDLRSRSNLLMPLATLLVFLANSTPDILSKNVGIARHEHMVFEL